MIDWSTERVERLTKLWISGLSASQIAKEMGAGITRNAVIGKVFRLGLSREFSLHPHATRGPAKSVKVSSISGRDRRSGVTTFGRETVSEVKARIEGAFKKRETTFKPQAVPLTAKTILDGLSSHECRWPVTAPPVGLADQTLFCYQVAEIGRRYCAAHHRLSIEVPSTPESRTQAAKLFEKNLRRHYA